MDPLSLCCQFLTSPRVKEWLKQQLIQLKLYEARLEELKDVVVELEKEREKVLKRVRDENRHGKIITREVEEWIGGVTDVFSEYRKFDEDKSLHELAVFDVFTNGYLPKPGIRYRRSREAFDIISKVNGKLQTAKFDTFAEWSGPPSKAAVLDNDGYENFPSRDEIVKNFKAALENPSVRMIGLHGLKGVGKTTLVKEVVKDVEANKKFVVTMANLEGNPGIREIQRKIAGWLGIILGEESDIVRAAQLENHLKQKSTLVVLDHLCAKLDLKILGIPSVNVNDDNLDNVKKGKSRVLHSMMEIEETLDCYKVCKVLLISESKQLLLSQMGGKENNIFSMEVLKEEEAVTFFRKIAGIGDGKSELDRLATQIAKCNRLPSSIIETAEGLKNQESHSAWKNALQKLEWQMSSGVPEFSTKLSYDLLEDEELKNTFLLCARMGPDALSMDLVKHSIGLDYLQGVHKVREARDRIHELVRKLKLFALLSDNHSSDHVTMQEIVRSAALSIASDSKEKHVFTMTKRRLDKWPDEDKLESYTSISLHHCEIIEGSLKRINCPRLRAFHVDNNDPRLEIPKHFFEGMKELRVLTLTGIHLSPSDSSVASLENLRMLCLEQCMLDKDLSFIGHLKELRILSFSGSDIEKLPVELKQLKKLQIFDISNCSKLTEIPSNVISSLISLEELYMRNTFIQWKLEGRAHPSGIASLSEFRHLIQNRLTTLDIQIPVVACLPKDLLFDKLRSYKIVVGDVNAYFEMDFKMPEKYEVSRFLAIQLKDGFDIHSQEGIKMLFERVEYLFLENLNGVQDLFYTLNLKGFPYLKHLSIVSNSEIQSLIIPKDTQHLEKAFLELESLYLYNLKMMKVVCSCQLSASSFAKLKVIKINLCGQVNNVFSVSVVRLLIVLETIEVSECNSLEKIVPVEAQSNTNEIGLLTFPGLRSLMLRSLPEFIGFYPMSSTKREITELFHEKVVVSKLERMELSCIKIDKIWSDQTSLNSYFTNLIHLDVNCCWNLTYLLSFSMAKSLLNLQSLFISDCSKMRYIFVPGKESRDIMKGIFKNLKIIKLSSMKSLSEIWNCELPSDSFGNLDTLIIEDCDELVSVFPCYMEGIFKSLCNLRVTNCRSMRTIFDLDDKKGDVDVINLQDFHLQTLPELENVWKWNKHQDVILKLNNLQKMWVCDCNSLENIFPFSGGRNLSNLEYLVVCDCSKLREIVDKVEGTNTAGTSSPNISFVFPKLTTIKFSKLPKFKSFYRGDYELSCPALNNLSVELCDELEPFRKGTADEKPVLFPEEVINKLKSIQIESGHAESRSSYMGIGNYRWENLEELHLCRLTDTDIQYSFLYRNPDLKSLSLINCFFEEIVSLKRLLEYQNVGVVPQLKSLKLIDLPNLNKIGFEHRMFIQQIELLILKNCPHLVNIMPSSVSLTNLTYLEVVNCNGLKTLMPLSSAKSMGQLNAMKIIKCESLLEIVENEDENGDIVFRQLKALELVSLKSLKRFCSSKTCVFVFPSLEKLVVSACPKMENFCEVKITPLIQKIYVVPENEKRWCWKYNLNATIRYIFKEKKFLEGMDEINLSEHPELQETWYGIGNPFMLKNWFYSLKILKLENCKIQSCAIPSNILPCLRSLKELEVRDCHNVEVIFDFNDAEIMGTTSQFKKLTLERLHKLTHVWKKNLQVSHNFQNLQQVIVIDCKNLKTLFPAALAENLMKLEKLEIKSCDEMLGIVGEETAGKEVRKRFLFPYLTSLHLTRLPKLTHFYPGTFTLECPTLITLSVFYCFELMLFQSTHVGGETEGSSTSCKGQPLFLDFRAISNLEELTIDWKDTLAFSSFGQFMENLTFLFTLVLNLYNWDVNKEPRFPFEILEKAPNIKALYIHNCSSPEILLSQNPKIGEDRMLGHLEILSLNHITNLQFIRSEGSSFLNTICERLHGLIVSNCPDLTTLVHPASAVSFSYLKELNITECHGLNSLFTSSVAKQLIYLEEIKVEKCNTMLRIVEMDDTSEGVKFEQLDRIFLNSLSSLECFYSGSDTLQLPSLIQVDILKCPKMEVFSGGSIDVKSIRGIRIDDDLNLNSHDDINLSVGMKFLRQVQQDHLVVGVSLLFQKIWLGSMAVPDSVFCNLKTLVLEGCEFLSNAIMPSHLLPSLRNLEELQVRKCNSVTAIFNQTKTNNMGPASDALSVCLKKLILEQLPILEHVWNEDSQRSLNIPFLEEVLVDGCESIKSLFPASVKKDRLQILHVKNCGKLVEIVAMDSVAAEKENEKLFPSLTLLKLWNLPNLRCIYAGMDILKWPKLKELDILNCQMLEIFSTKVQNSPYSIPKGLDRFRTNWQPSVSLAMVTPNLKLLSLGNEEVMMIKQEKLNVDFSELYSLKLQCFSDESRVFEFVSYSVKPTSIENLWVVHSAFKEIFPFGTPYSYGKMSQLFLNLKGLKLQSLPQLESIGLEHSWMEPFVEKLETISVLQCDRLTNLTPSNKRVPFSNLIELKVEDCHGLNYLFSSSTAKTLRVLKKMQITNCRSIQNIVANEDEDENSITFEQLQFLTLTSLPKLETFYSGSSTLNFPSMKKLSISGCYKMEVFCSGNCCLVEEVYCYCIRSC